MLIVCDSTRAMFVYVFFMPTVEEEEGFSSSQLLMVWTLIVSAVRAYAPWIMLPVTMTIGFIGYNFENFVRRPKSILKVESTLERREERRLKEMQSADNK